MIDIIIPVYNSHDTLYYSLASIAMQTIKDKVKVTIVDDNSDKDYYDTVSIFKKDLDINYLKLDSNRGPGVAREYGLNNTDNEYIIFMDSDDQFMNCYSLEKLYNSIVLNDLDMVIGLEWVEGSGIDSDNTFSLHSKIYKRKHITDNNIHFNCTRYSEDNSFNQICMNTTDKCLKLDDILYIYMYNSNSTTQDKTKRLEIIMSYIFNAIWTVKELEKRNVDKWKISNALTIFYRSTYMQVIGENQDFNYDKLYKCCYMIEEIFEDYKDYCSDNDVVKLILGETLYNENSLLRKRILEDFKDFRLKFKRSINND